MKVVFNPKKFWLYQTPLIGCALITLALFIFAPNEGWTHQDTSFRAEKLYFLLPLIPITVFLNIIWKYFTNRLKTIEFSGKQVTLIFVNKKKELNLLTEVLLSKKNIFGYKDVTLQSRLDFYTIPAYYDLGINESVESFVVKYSEEQKIPVRDLTDAPKTE